MTVSSDKTETAQQKLFQQVHETIEKLPKLKWGDKFQFNCHKGVKCWTACCSNLNLFMTPYDVLRLKRCLGLKSSEFLQKYANVSVDPGFGLPVATLRMTGDGKCPFVTPDGCNIYDDRPTTCRLYPLGQGASSGTATSNSEKLFFKIQEDHCFGWEEPKEWTLEEWVIDQGANEYNLYNEMIVRMTFHPKMVDAEKLDEKKTGMIFMSLYDLDTFRDFIFKSSFLDKFEVDAETVEKIRTMDEDLLRFGMKWIEFSVMGMRSIRPKGMKPEAEDDQPAED